MNTYYDSVSILYTPSPTYDVMVDARCNTEGTVVNVGIAMDGSSTGLSTPHTFSGLDGSHTFTVPIADIEGHLFSQWSTGQTSMTITVSSGGTYTAYYSAPAPSGNVTRVPEDYKSVQAAIDAASPGSTIVIGPRVYNESIIVNKNLTIIGKLGSEPIFKGGGSGIAITLLAGASGSLIAGIVITSWDEGMLINNASDCKIYDNIMSQMNNCGIALQGNDTSNNFICSNIFQNTTVAIVLTSSSHNNTVYRNIITSNDLGVELESGKNFICANSITENDIGLDLSNSNNSVVYHNNFVNNSVQVSISTSIGNTWDDGYPSGGNYWSDHTGPDMYNGQNQDQLGADGIVDTDYVVAGGGVDRYPLAQPFNAHDVGITDCTILNTVVGGGYTLHVEVKILNYGVYDENFLVTAYANLYTAVTQGVALAQSSYIIIALTWNTTGFAYGNYTISVCAGPVRGETNTADNNFTKGCVMVSLVGDITGPIGCPDGRCDMRDVGAVARLFGINYPSPQYNPNYDINSDSKINMIDIGTVARHFGEHYP
jgi:parallel beta-helix repeat protein